MLMRHHPGNGGLQLSIGSIDRNEKSALQVGVEVGSLHFQSGLGARRDPPLAGFGLDRPAGFAVKHRLAETMRRHGAKHAPDNVAKQSLIPDTIISRVQLRPKYGQGWQPRLGSLPRQGDIRDLGKEESP